MGFDHKEMGINCQDFGFINETLKCVVDGCSEGLHSEVGAKLFCQLFKEGFPVYHIFQKMLTVIGAGPQNIRNYLCFTILTVSETENEFIVNYCGDGFIIKQTHGNSIEFVKLDDGEYPQYYAYNFIDKSFLKCYQGGVSFSRLVFSKAEYKKIGIATDGMRYIFNKDYETDFIDLLIKNKESAVKRLINRKHKHFKDDITLIL
jgi:hypothetical protein